MRLAKKLTLLAFIGVGAGSLLASCGDNAQTCGPGTEPNVDGICLPNGDGPDAAPRPDSDPTEPDAELLDASTAPTTTGTIAVTDTTVVDPTAALVGGVRGGAIRISFSDLTMPGHHGGVEVYRQNPGAPVQGCLVTRFDADNLPNDRLDAGIVTLAAPAAGTSALLKTVGPCSFLPLLGDPDPYACISHAAATQLVVAQDLGDAPFTGAVAYVFTGPTAVDFGMTPAATITGATLSSNFVTVTTAAAHGYFPSMNVTVAGVTRASTGAITAAARVGGITTITAVNDLTTGNPVTVAGVTAVGATTFNGTFTVTSATGTSFTYAQAAVSDDTGAGGTTTLRPYNGRHVITGVTGTTFTYALTGIDSTGTGGTSAVPTQRIASSALSINGFANAAFNSGASAFPIIAQLDANTIVVSNAAPAPGTSANTAGTVNTGAYTILNGFSPVPIAGANADFLGRDGSVRITKVANSVWPAIDETVDVPGEALAPVANTGLVRASNVTTATVPTGHGYTTGQRVIVAGASPASFNGTHTVTGTTATTFTYANTGTGETATAAGTAQKPSFTLDPASNFLHTFPRVTAAMQSYGCDNDTPADLTDDTCGDASTTILKALIISGSATKRSVAGIFPFQMPTEVSGSDTAWLEWQCAFVGSKSVDIPVDMVTAILNFAPTRIESQALFVAGNLLGDGSVANEGQLRLLVGHAIAGHVTFSTATGNDAFGLPVSNQCNDGIDNETTPDGLIDWPADPGCGLPNNPGADVTE